jgi:hypothetical protein
MDAMTKLGDLYTPGRAQALERAAEARGLPVDAARIETCADEKTGQRYGNAACRRGRAVKLGRTTYQYQVWAVFPSAEGGAA